MRSVSEGVREKWDEMCDDGKNWSEGEIGPWPFNHSRSGPIRVRKSSCTSMLCRDAVRPSLLPLERRPKCEAHSRSYSS